MITIYVSEDDIEHGIRNNCYRCPIARAIKRQFPGNPFVVVRNDYCFVDFRKGSSFTFNLLSIAKYFINNFDGGYDDCEVFSFNLENPRTV